jgi:hypothetical protein
VNAVDIAERALHTTRATVQYVRVNQGRAYILVPRSFCMLRTPHPRSSRCVANDRQVRTEAEHARASQKRSVLASFVASLDARLS